MNDLDRWAEQGGPPPPGMREVLDVLAPPLSPEHEAALDRRVYAAIAEDRASVGEVGMDRRCLTWILSPPCPRVQPPAPCPTSRGRRRLVSAENHMPPGLARGGLGDPQRVPHRDRGA
jgi:hypothetical protein